MISKLLVFKNKFYFILFTSILINIITAKNHFQEIDSDGVFHILNQPSSSISFFSRHIDFELFNEFTEKANIENYINPKCLENIGKFRICFIEMLFPIDQGNVIKKYISVPLSSTYTLGMGVVYSFIHSLFSGYSDFIFYSQILLVILLHIGFAYLYSLLKLISKSKNFSLVLSLIYLFSISIYSYSFHLGSTVWILSSTLMFLYYVFLHLHKKLKFSFFILIAFLLFLFNYLIFVFLIIYILFLFFYYKRRLVNEVFNFRNATFIGITFFFFSIIILFFFPFGNTNPSESSVSNIFTDIYHLTINNFSLLNNYKLLNYLQFIFFLFISIFSINKILDIQNDKFSIYIKTIYLFYAASFLFEILGFSPSRHLLIFTPLIIITVAIVIKNNKTFSRSIYLHIDKKINLFLILLVLLSLISHFQRHKLTKKINIKPYIEKYQYTDKILYDTPFEYFYTLNNAYLNYGDKILKSQKQSLNKIIGMKKYIYISQTTDIETFKTMMKRKNIQVANSSLIYKKENKVLFTSSNPDLKYENSRFKHNRPNNVYIYLVEFNL